MSIKSNLLPLLIGFFLGIIGPLIVDKFKKSFNKNNFIKGINSELKELQSKFLHTAYQLGLRAGKHDRDFIEWCSKIYTKFNENNESETFPLLIAKLLKLNDEELNSYLNLQRAKSKGVGFSLKKYHMTFLESKFNEISMLNTKLHKPILDLKARIDMINEEIEFAMKYHFMTFDASITPENHEIIRNEIDRKYSIIQNMMINIVKRINDYLEK